MSKPESETDPWAKVKRRQGTVIEHGPGVLGGGAWSAKAAVYLAKEVDAARAAEAAQHKQNIADREDAMIKLADLVMRREEQRDACAAERDRLKAELTAIANANPKEWDEEVGDQFQAWAQSRARFTLAALTPQHKSTDGETK